MLLVHAQGYVWNGCRDHADGADDGGLSWLLLPFFANAHYAMELREKGWLDERQWQEQQRAKKIAAAVGSQVAGSVSIAGELEKLARLHREGMLTQDEFLALKARLVAASRES